MFGITDRRHFMAHAAGAAAVTVPGLSFLTNLRSQAAEMKKKNKSLIILWMGGGPATIDLWDMKPGTANGGEHKPISTAAGSDVKITEHLPMVAKQFKNLSIIRSLQTREGDHQRGTFLMNTGRSPNPLTEFPSIGSVMSYYQAMDVEAMKQADIPSFISVGGSGRIGPGFLGMKYASFNVQNPGQPPENVNPPVSSVQMDRRKVLFESLEGGFKTNVPADAAKAHTVSLTDDEHKLVFSRLGDRLRIAGTAELNGYSTELNLVRCDAILKRAQALFPGAGDASHAQFWTGLRPATPSNVPYIGKSRIANLYLNTGHGTLGWTHACGSGRAIADILSGRQPEVDFAFCGMQPKLRKPVRASTITA